jgi:hypothetical protein
MGLDVANRLFGNIHFNWAATSWFQEWCYENGLPNPFIGWNSGDNSGDQYELKGHPEARAWCVALVTRFPEIAELGKSLLANPPADLLEYLYPHRKTDPALPAEQLHKDEWERRAVAAWYAILRHGVERGDTLEYC